MPQCVLETHFHTSEVSSCSHVRAAEGMALLAQSGYDAVVITDHYTPQTFARRRHLSWPEQVDWFLSGYQAASEAGQALNIAVLPGMEIRFQENSNDYLVYGIDRTFLVTCPDLFQMTIESFSALARANGLLIYQAHPFRNKMTIVNPRFLFGLEGINSHPRHESRNDIAQAWAKKHHLPVIAGSDFHQAGDQGGSRLIFPRPIQTNTALVDALKGRQYQIVTA